MDSSSGAIGTAVNRAIEALVPIVAKATMKAAEGQGSAEATRRKIRALVASETFGERFVTKILGRELGLSGD